ncbi:MAG: NTP transferase domain-containing protein [Sandaracinaceae bacterium]|nr:NTP transferase domain-containing protein [Sandaracinaceae bacterium]
MSTEHLFAVVMAGGSGTRFWPLSRRLKPKQLLALAEPERTLLASTVERVAPLVPTERVLVVTGHHLAEGTRMALPSLPPINVLAEPIAKNTAPCVAWAAYHALARDPDAVLAVLAADHFVIDGAAYLEVIRRAVTAAADGSLVTVGIKPSRPETGYGYLEVGGEVGPGFSHTVLRFVEKPDAVRAIEFVQSGRFLWNSGQFFFRADAIVRAFEQHMPELARAMGGVRHAPSRAEEMRVVDAAYAGAASISIDHGIMEKAERVRVIPGDFGWSDVGSWTTAWELAKKDDAGNAGTAAFVDARGNFVHAPSGKVVAMLGVSDLVVVDTPDALLVMPRERAQDVRAIVDALKGKRDDVL